MFDSINSMLLFLGSLSLREAPLFLKNNLTHCFLSKRQPQLDEVKKVLWLGKPESNTLFYVIDNKTKNDITYITQIQLLFDQEKKSTRVGDVELLKRVIRSEEGTFTGHIKALEKKLGGEVSEFKAPFMNNENSAIETTTTLN